jgi:hypothetical protein
MKELSEKSYVWITSTANHEFAILLTKKEHSHNQLTNTCLWRKLQTGSQRNEEKNFMKVNKDLDVQDFFTPNQSLYSLNTYQESFPRKDNLHKNWMQAPTGFFRRTIWLCWHVGHSRTLSPAGLCSPPPCDLKEIKPTKQLTPLAKKMWWSLTTNYKKHGDSITIDAKLQKQTWFFVADYGICIVGNLSWKINLSKKTPMASISLSFCALACQTSWHWLKLWWLLDMTEHSDFPGRLWEKQRKKEYIIEAFLHPM